MYLRAPPECLASPMDHGDDVKSLSYRPLVIQKMGILHDMKVYVLAPWIESKHMWTLRDFFFRIHQGDPKPKSEDQAAVIKADGNKNTRKRKAANMRCPSHWVHKFEAKVQKHLQLIYPGVHREVIPCAECSARKTGGKLRKARGHTGISFNEVWECKQIK